MKAVRGFIDNDASVVGLFQLVLLVIACNWGVDYMMDPPHYSLYIYEQMMDDGPIPLPLWGFLLLSLAILGFIGEVWIQSGNHDDSRLPAICRSERRWLPSFIAHAGLCSAYLAIGVGCALEQFNNSHLHGLRMTSSVMFGLALGHAIFAWRRRHVPVP